MIKFTAFEYVLIDIANQYGLDKLTFEERIKWTKENYYNLEALGEDKYNAEEEWKEYPLYIVGVSALRVISKGYPTGHMIGFDATCSGLQILSVISGCEHGCMLTNLIDEDNRYDAYMEVFMSMLEILPDLEDVSRSDIKDVVMKGGYGSRAEPIRVFGEDTEELATYYEAFSDCFEGADLLIESLRNSWRSSAYKHVWVLPDEHTASVKVKVKKVIRPKIEELNNASFTYVYSENQPTEFGLKNIANVTQSIDAYIARSVIRRCSYGKQCFGALDIVQNELLLRETECRKNFESTLEKYKRYQKCKVVDISVVYSITKFEVMGMSTSYLKKLLKLLTDVVEYPPFDVVTIHDEFKCHPNNMNQLRFHYKEVMADLADSKIAQDILSQIYGYKIHYVGGTSYLAKKIRNSNYAIC